MQNSQELDPGTQAFLTRHNGSHKAWRKSVGDVRDTYHNQGAMMADSQYGDRFQLIEPKPAPTTFKALESFGENIVKQTPILSRDHHHDAQFLNAIEGGLSGITGLDPN